ncbi:putative serine esterase-domain-containing protein [Limtongia smithiae]|uniref:putative serine esterase-domain-containing protein n=1 Tax=Limtongia smithiae TaxID=1125753 RepID=UPI0034CDD6CA
MSADHLFVLLHGLWGKPAHMEMVKENLLKQHPDVSVLVVSTYSGNLTYDGVSVCGNRVIEEMKEKIEDTKNDEGVVITKISIIGYSLGGLIGRYVAGELFRSGFFDTIAPMNFTTFATPHLGTYIGTKGITRSMFNMYGKKLLSQSGRDLFLGDDCILPKLSDPSECYYQALEKFKRISLYANIANDRSVPFHTAFIAVQDPFRDLEHYRPYHLKGYSEPVIVDLSKPMKQLEVPYKRRWSSRDYVFTGMLVSIGPLVAFLAVIAITTAAQLSELRIRSLTDGKSPDNAVLSKRRTSTAHHDVGAGLSQNVVEGLLDNPVADHLDSDNMTAADGSMYSTSDSEDLQKNVSYYSIDLLCEALEEQERSAPVSTSAAKISLELLEEQYAMCESLNKLPWNKYAVEIHSSLHSHAVIVNRNGKMTEGNTVLSHWAQRAVI